MDGSKGRETRINSFALVSYLTGPLADLLDEIRHDFAPESRAKAHLTILPPRPLASFDSSTAIPEALQELQTHLQDFAPFDVDLGDIEVFPDTFVIYVSIKSGFEKLERMHQALNAGSLAWEEPHSYHPHVTVVQELAPGRRPQCRAICALALERIQTLPYRAGRPSHIRSKYRGELLD